MYVFYILINTGRKQFSKKCSQVERIFNDKFDYYKSLHLNTAFHKHF